MTKDFSRLHLFHQTSVARPPARFLKCRRIKVKMSQLKDKSQYTKLQTCHVQKILEFSGILLLLRPWKNTMRKLQDMKMKCCTRLETIKKSNYVSINSFYDTGGGTHNSTSIGKNNHFSHNEFPTWLLQVRDHRSDHAKKNCPIFPIGVSGSV